MVFRNEALLRALRRFELLANTSDETVRRLALEAVSRRVARGFCLWRSGMRADQVILVRSGYVAVRGASGGAGRSVYTFVGPGDVSGVEPSLDWGVRTASAYVSSERAEFYVLDPVVLSRTARKDPALARALESAYALGPAAFEPKMRVLHAGSPARRLATLLTSLVERHGRVLSGGMMQLPNAPSLLDLAAYACLNPEAATALLSTWTVQGIVRLDEGNLVVESPESLENLAVPNARSSGDDLRTSGVIRRSVPCGELALEAAGDAG